MFSTERWHTGFSYWVVPLTVLIVVAVSGCSTSEKQPEGPVAPRLLQSALSNLHTSYVEEFNISGAVENGLRALIDIDPSIEVSNSGDRIAIYRVGALLSQRLKPAPANIRAWAGLTSDLIQAMHSQSPLLQSARSADIEIRVMNGLLEELDKHSRYLTPAEAKQSRHERDGFGGIGIALQRTGSAIMIRRVLKKTPADEAGLVVGDEILTIDGKSAANYSVTDAFKALRGPVGQAVTLTIVRNDRDNIREIQITRRSVVAPSVKGSVSENILTVRIDRFNHLTSQHLKTMLQETVQSYEQPLTGLIVDLRNNPGGLLKQAVAAADIFLDDGNIIATKGRHPKSNQQYDATPGAAYRTLPIVILINGQTASAAEILAVALRDQGRASIVGSTSFGKGSVQSVIDLPNGGALHVTWARIVAPSDQIVENQGVVPAICTNLMTPSPPFKQDTDETERLRTEHNAYRSSSHFNRIRAERCPPTKKTSPSDIGIALKILKTPALYRATLVDKQSPQP